MDDTPASYHVAMALAHLTKAVAALGLTTPGTIAEAAGTVRACTPGALRAREYRARQRTRARTDERTEAHAPCAPEASSETAKNPATTGENAESATVADAHGVRTACAGGVRGVLDSSGSYLLTGDMNTEDKTKTREAHACARTVRGVRTNRNVSDPDPSDPPFTSSAFQEAWSGFRAMRDRMGAPMTARAIRLAWEALRPVGEAKAIAALDTCVQLNWKGVAWGIERVTSGGAVADSVRTRAHEVDAQIRRAIGGGA